MSYHDRIDILAALVATSDEVTASACVKVTGWTKARALEVLRALEEQGLILAVGTRNLRARAGGRPTRIFQRRPGVVIPQGWRDQKRIDERKEMREALVDAGCCSDCGKVNDSAPLKMCAECRRTHQLRQQKPFNRPNYKPPILAEFVKGPATMPELALALGWTHSRVYDAVKTLEASGHVGRAGERKTTGKPATVWALAATEAA